MSHCKILVAEDEPAINDIIYTTLTNSQFNVTSTYNALEANRCIIKSLPDLILLDWMMPGDSGISFIKQLRSNEFTAHIPVIMLTAKDREEDLILGLDAGADDYITKPFSPKALIARIKCVIRRTLPTLNKQTISRQGITLDPESCQVTVKDRHIPLGPTDFKLLHVFMAHYGVLFNREQLLDKVWGTNIFIGDRTVDVHIRRLRKALKNCQKDKLIQTVRGLGYRFTNSSYNQ